MKKLLREKAVRRAALINNIEDLNLRMLALIGEVRYLDDEIDTILQRMRQEYLEENGRPLLTNEDFEYPIINPYSG